MIDKIIGAVLCVILVAVSAVFVTGAAYVISAMFHNWPK